MLSTLHPIVAGPKGRHVACQRERKPSSFVTISYASYFPAVFPAYRTASDRILRRLSSVFRFLFRYASVFCRYRTVLYGVGSPKFVIAISAADCSDSSCSPFSLRLCLFAHDIGTVHGSVRCHGFDVTVSFFRGLGSADF